MKKFAKLVRTTLILSFGLLASLPAFARDFSYTYEGQTLTYTVIDEDAKTCATRAGHVDDHGYIVGGNYVSGSLVIPATAKDGGDEYSVVSVGDYAFIVCSSLTSVTIGNAVTSIGNGAFSGCHGLTSVTIGNAVTSIGSGAFQSCSSLTSVVIPDAVTSIGNSAFYGCSSLTSIVIPDAVTSIGRSAFNGCSGLTSVTIGNAVTSIGGGAFQSCSSLTSVVIPDAVTSIEDAVFYGCSSLTSIVIPDAVTSIGRSAFNGCSGLEVINIGSGLQSIENSAFRDCHPLEIYVNSQNPPVGCFYAEESISKYNTFNDYTATLYVPASAVDAYKSDAMWKNFTNIQPYGFSGVDEIGADREQTRCIVDGATIIVTAQDNQPVEIYDISGMPCFGAVAKDGEIRFTPSLPGVYIVRCGSVTQKVIVK